jgi:hypothetical protein
LSIIWGKREEGERGDYICHSLDVISVLMKVLLYMNYETVLGKTAFYSGLLKER